MKTKLIALGAAGALAIAAVPAFAATKTIRVDDNVFSPKSTSVSKGTTVKFRFVGEAPHNVKRTGGPRFTAISNRRSGTISRKLNTRGTLKLTCTIHPGMDLSIRVR